MRVVLLACLIMLGCSKKKDDAPRQPARTSYPPAPVPATGPANGAECERVAAHLEKLSNEAMPPPIRARFVADCAGVLKRSELECILGTTSSFQDTFKCRKWEAGDPPHAEPMSPVAP